MKFLKIIYWILARFGWGWGLISSPMALVRDLGTALLVLALLFKVKFSPTVDVLIGIVSFALIVGAGEFLYRKGILDYATKLGNSVNPELKLIRRIAEKLDVHDN